MEFGDKIKYYRELNGMTQEELAKRLGYTSRSSIAKIETGNSDLPLSKVVAFARVFNVAPNDLLPSKNDMQTEIEQRLLDKIRKLKDISALETYVDFLIAQQNK